MSKFIFVVDDNATNLTMAEEALAEQYRVIALPSAAKMFSALEKFKPDLILLDVQMPGMNGFEAMEKLKENDLYADVPVIFLTGLSDNISEAHGIELGAMDFIMKPFSKPVLLNRIRNHLHLDEIIRDRTDRLRERTTQLVERTEQLERLKNGIVFTWADLVESRDANTGGHINRTASYLKVLIDAMMERNVCTNQMQGWDIESVIASANLHDIGKILIPDSILNKPGPLTEEEFRTMKTHATEGERIIEQAIERTGEAEFLQNARIFAAYHHERWDGKGYPYGLNGTYIPLQGRIMAIIDVYDALVSNRAYKKAIPHDEAFNTIMEDSGKHFDPSITEVFGSIGNKIKKARGR